VANAYCCRRIGSRSLDGLADLQTSHITGLAETHEAARPGRDTGPHRHAELVSSKEQGWRPVCARWSPQAGLSPESSAASYHSSPSPSTRPRRGPMRPPPGCAALGSRARDLGGPSRQASAPHAHHAPTTRPQSDHHDAGRPVTARGRGRVPSAPRARRTRINSQVFTFETFVIARAPFRRTRRVVWGLPRSPASPTTPFSCIRYSAWARRAHLLRASADTRRRSSTWTEGAVLQSRRISPTTSST